MLGYELRCQPGRGLRHFVNSEADGVQRPRPFRFRVRFVLLDDRHDHVTLVARSSGYAYVELGVHGCGLRISGTASGVVSAPPPPPGQHGTPRLLRVQRRFGHPVVRTDVDDVELREMPSEVFERHPAHVTRKIKCNL